MNINFNFDKESIKKIGHTSWRITKAIGIRGIKGLVTDTAIKTINSSFDEGFGAFKKVDLDYVIGKENVDKPKRKLFSKKKDKAEEVLEETKEELVDWKEYQEEKPEEVEPEVIEPKTRKNR